MSQIGRLYEAYCKEHEVAQIAPEELQFYETLSGIVPHKDYLKIEALISTGYDRRDKEYFFAGFRAAMHLMREVSE